MLLNDGHRMNTGQGLDHVMYDPQAGYLDARNACIAVKDLFIKEGGTFIQRK